MGDRDLHESGIAEDQEPPVMTAAKLNADTAFFTDMADFIPDEHQTRLNNRYIDWATEIGKNIPNDDGSSSERAFKTRLSLFAEALTLIVKASRHSTSKVTDVLAAPLAHWQKILPGSIDHAFIEEEVLTFCQRLNGQGHLT